MIKMILSNTWTLLKICYVDFWANITTKLGGFALHGQQNVSFAVVHCICGQQISKIALSERTMTNITIVVRTVCIIVLPVTKCQTQIFQFQLKVFVTSYVFFHTNTCLLSWLIGNVSFDVNCHLHWWTTKSAKSHCPNGQ